MVVPSQWGLRLLSKKKCFVMSKRLKKAYSVYDKNESYTIDEAVEMLEKYKNCASVKFDESVDVIVKLGIDSNKPDQLIKGFVNLPHGNGKKNKVLVFANDDNVDKALKAGATYVGGDDLVARVASGEVADFDKCVATSSMMPKLAKIARVLGSKGLMPNPKLGTVVNGDVTPVVESLSKGRANIKVEKDGSVKTMIGKMSFNKSDIVDNLKEVLSAIKQLRPASVKAGYFDSVSISTTMGIGVKIKISEVYSIS